MYVIIRQLYIYIYIVMKPPLCGAIANMRAWCGVFAFYGAYTMPHNLATSKFSSSMHDSFISSTNSQQGFKCDVGIYSPEIWIRSSHSHPTSGMLIDNQSRCGCISPPSGLGTTTRYLTSSFIYGGDTWQKEIPGTRVELNNVFGDSCH